MKIVKWLLLTPVVLIALGVLGTEINKAYWDNKVKELCEKDGGVSVFEVVHLTKEQYLRNGGKNGMIQVFSLSGTKPTHDYYWVSTDTIINKTNPKVIRSEYVTHRKIDNKQLGKWITYSRSGGDLPIGFHPSSFSCSNITGFKRGAVREIFITEME